MCLLLSSGFSAESVDVVWTRCRAGVEGSAGAVLLVLHTATVRAVRCTAGLDDCINGGERSGRRHFYGWPTINSSNTEAHAHAVQHSLTHTHTHYHHVRLNFLTCNFYNWRWKQLRWHAAFYERASASWLNIAD